MLTPKQKRFVEEYLIDLNATAASKRAGYSSAACANRIASELLGKPEVAAAIAEAQAKRAARTEITQDRVLQELARIAFFDMRLLYREDGSMKPPNEWDDDAAAVLSGLDVTEEFEGSGQERTQVGWTKKAKVFDKAAALALAMRHLGMLNDKMQLTGITVTVKDYTGRKRDAED